jgi:FOG: FHA domain
MLRIIVERAGEVVYDRIFRKSLITVGREAVNDLVLADERVSSQHLVVKRDTQEGWFRLFDQSVNGTFWEGDRISTLRFDHAAMIVVADFHLTLLPIARSGTVESSEARLPAPSVPPPPSREVDPFARTAVEEIPNPVEEVPTSMHQKLRPAERRKIHAELRSISSEGELRSIVFIGSAMIGRSSDCDLRFTSRDISRHHCVINATDSGFVLRRLSEKNAIYINDRELAQGESMELRDGDVIRICDEEVVFLCPATQPKAELPNVTFESNTNLDLAINRRGCSDPEVAAYDLVGFLGVKTMTRFENEMLENFQRSRRILLDVGYLVGIDGAGMASLGRVIKEAERGGVEIQIIRVTPRIADLLSFSALKQLLVRYISSSEETAIRKLRCA